MRKRKLSYFTTRLLGVLGVVMVWRGVWYLLDEVDMLAFGRRHLWTALLGILIGLALLYFPDKDLKEIEKL